MSSTKFGVISSLMLALCSADAGWAAMPLKLTGGLVGSVTNAAGIPQMGATVLLYNRYDRPIQKALTNARGSFGFDNLTPDTYSIRVSLASFVPALKRNITVQPGVESVLAINLASVLSSIELVYSTPTNGSLMSDDWKWVLRSSMASRPVLRFDSIPGITATTTTASAFSDTTGVVKVSSGDTTGLGAQSDLGTTFALATSLYGRNQLKFTGNIGYSMDSPNPNTGFRTSFSRPDLAGTEVKLTMQQYTMPLRGAPVIGGRNGNAPALRTLSLTVLERADLGPDIHIDYGASLDSVMFLDRLNYISPFARLTFDLGDKGTFVAGYSSGAPPIDLLTTDREKEADRGLAQEMAAVSMYPRVSMRNGTARVQRTQNYELGYALTRGSRTYSVGAYREVVGNATLLASASPDLFDHNDLLPDLSSNSFVFNIGNYTRYGYSLSVTQELGSDYSVEAAYGNGGVLTADGGTLESENPEELRKMIHPGQRRWVALKVTGLVPTVGTLFTANYEWSDSTALTPGHVYLTQRYYPGTGLNVRLRQPLPSFGGLPGRLEASAELRNLLAQGYLPITTKDAGRVVLTNSPRSVRGGLAFIF